MNCWMLYVVYGNSVEYGTCRGHALFSTNEIPEEDKKSMWRQLLGLFYQQVHKFH